MSAAIAPLFDRAFPRLHKAARRLLIGERPGHTLQPTALVAETFLRLHRIASFVSGEEHFFRLASRTMTRILIDHARSRKHRGSISVEEIPDLLVACTRNTPNESSLAVRHAFSRLRTIDPIAADALWLRTVEGWTIDEVSQKQARESWRVRADCDYTLTWLAGELRG